MIRKHTQTHAHTQSLDYILFPLLKGGCLFLLMTLSGVAGPSPRIVKWLLFLQWNLCLGQTCSNEQLEAKCSNCCTVVVIRHRHACMNRVHGVLEKTLCLGFGTFATSSSWRTAIIRLCCLGCGNPHRMPCSFIRISWLMIFAFCTLEGCESSLSESMFRFIGRSL